MSEYKINFSDYKASGVYYIEVDNSISNATRQRALRLAVGFNGKGPFNRPVYLASTTDCDDFLGPIDRKLERKGCFTNRAIRTMISKAPVYAINLLPVDTAKKLDENPDKAGYAKLTFAPTSESPAAKQMRYCDMFDRTKFWIADETAMMRNLPADDADSLFAVGNCGTSDISLIIRKAEGLTGFNVTFLDWYGKEEDIPYSWINPYDYVVDYFVQVIAVKGNLSNYANYAADPVWSEYFDANGLRKDKLNKFLRLDAVTVLGNWTGCIIPDFIDKQGRCRSINYLINNSTNKTGLMFGLNESLLDTLAYSKETGEYFFDYDGSGDFDATDASSNELVKIPVFDMAGISPESEEIMQSNSGFKFLSCSDMTRGKQYETLPARISGSSFWIAKSTISADSANGAFMPQVGDYVKCKGGYLKITKKTYSPIEVIDASTNAPARDSSGNIMTEEAYKFTTLQDLVAVDIVSGAYQVNDDIHIDNVVETEEGTGAYQDYMVYSSSDTDSSTGESWTTGNVAIRKSISDMYSHLQFVVLPSLKLANRHLPGFDAEGQASMEAGIEKIYGMLADSGIRRGLLNNEMIDFRYIVDTMAGGLKMHAGSKAILSELAGDKGHCTALINLPSMADFGKVSYDPANDSRFNAPLYYDVDNQLRPTDFNVKYITTNNANPDVDWVSESTAFSLPTFEQRSDCAAFFAPYLVYKEGVRKILVPPAADVCNALMNKFTGGDPYKTVANLNGIIDNKAIDSLEVDFDETDRGYLEPFGVNPIISYNGTIMIFGDRTAYQTVNSDLNFLHVRELLNTINIQAREILHDYVFGFNVATTRTEIYNKLNPMLKAMKTSNALLKYEIQVDEVNNTKEVIDEKFCIVDIGIWVTPNMEKIVTRVTLNRSTTA